jgi:hypothetical protein
MLRLFTADLGDPKVEDKPFPSGSKPSTQSVEANPSVDSNHQLYLSVQPSFVQGC